MSLDNIVLNYDCQETDDPDFNDEESITMEVFFFFANASRVTSSKMEIIPSSKNSIPSTNVSFTKSDFLNLDAFYNALISKARGTPSNKHFFVFVKYSEWKGFVCTTCSLFITFPR